MWKHARWLLASTAAVGISEQGLAILTAATLGLRELGYLTAGKTLFNLVNVILNGLESAVLPSMRKVWATNQGIRQWNQKYRELFIYTSLAVLPPSIILLVSPEHILKIVYGEPLIPGSWILQWLALLLIPKGLFRLQAIAALSIGKPSIGFWPLLASSFIVIILGWPLSTHMGMHGILTLYTASITICAIMPFFMLRTAIRRETGK